MGELSNLGCMTFNCYFILTEPSKDDIKRGRPQKCLNVEVGRVVPMAKTTLNVPPADHTNVARPTAKTTFETTDHTNERTKT